jgi:DNA-binding NarL/FixJ family response regulator
MENRQTKTLVVADELALVRDSLAAYCELSGAYRVVAACSDGEQAQRAIRQHDPDFAVLDLNLTGMYTLELISQLRHNGTRFVVLSTRQDRKTVLEVLRTGASGYVLKSGPASDLLNALQRIEDGGVFISPLIELEHLFNGGQAPAPDDPLKQLSSREYQVFTLLVEGVRPKEIAARLLLSPKTVDTYRANLMRKLEIYDVASLVKFALARRLTSVA